MYSLMATDHREASILSLQPSSYYRAADQLVRCGSYFGLPVAVERDCTSSQAARIEMQTFASRGIGIPGFWHGAWKWHAQSRAAKEER